jgi:type I restriction enzyme M protein
MGTKISRTQIELSADEIARIARTYHAWRGQVEAGDYADELGFCASTDKDGIAAEGGTLSPGRYVGAPEEEEDEIAFEERTATLVDALGDDLSLSAQLADEIRKVLGGIGYAV